MTFTHFGYHLFHKEKKKMGKSFIVKIFFLLLCLIELPRRWRTWKKSAKIGWSLFTSVPSIGSKAALHRIAGFTAKFNRSINSFWPAIDRINKGTWNFRKMPNMLVFFWLQCCFQPVYREIWCKKSHFVNEKTTKNTWKWFFCYTIDALWADWYYPSEYGAIERIARFFVIIELIPRFNRLDSI